MAALAAIAQQHHRTGKSVAIKTAPAWEDARDGKMLGEIGAPLGVGAPFLGPVPYGSAGISIAGISPVSACKKATSLSFSSSVNS